MKTEDGVSVLTFKSSFTAITFQFTPKENEEMIVSNIVPIEENMEYMLLTDSSDDFDISTQGEMVAVDGGKIDLTLEGKDALVSMVASLTLTPENVGLLKVIELPSETEIAVSQYEHVSLHPNVP